MSAMRKYLYATQFGVVPEFSLTWSPPLPPPLSLRSVDMYGMLGGSK